MICFRAFRCIAFKYVQTKRFEITVNAEADHHLGVNIQRLEDGSLKLTQSKLLATIFDECQHVLGSESTRPIVPLRPNNPQSEESTPYDRKSYLHLLGMLNYLLRSRPDISTALSYMPPRSLHLPLHKIMITCSMWWNTFGRRSTLLASLFAPGISTNPFTSSVTLTPPSCPTAILEDTVDIASQLETWARSIPNPRSSSLWRHPRHMPKCESVISINCRHPFPNQP